MNVTELHRPFIPSKPSIVRRQDQMRRYREYQEAIAPIIREMVRIEGMRSPPLLLIHPDGRFEVGPKSPLPEPLEKVMAQYRELIAQCAVQIIPEFGCTH